MRLTTLEIKGFKSFAERTVINFNEDVIGIVGPNGCGKSNIVDAMRWVLGEQKSKELRLDKMSNVIFNGSKRKRQSGVAEVSLTFENTKNILPTEFGTVTVTRILYRSGESEYRINGVTCRLKDISNLFMDTGIGSDSYAIIALNMVDDLLTDRDNSRRRLFEQAAGISKYKNRKRETVNKLNSTTDDLERVEDLLHEIESNLKRLEKEAKRAKKFLDLKEEYKTLSVDLAVHQLQDYTARYKKLAAALEAEQDKYRTLEVQIREKEAQLEKTKSDNLDNEKKLSDEQRKLNQIVADIRKAESEQQLANQKIQYVEQRQETLRRSIQEHTDNQLHVEEELDYYRSEINIEKEVEETLDLQLANAEADLNEIRTRHQSLKAELDDFIVQQRQIDNEIFQLEKQQAIFQAQISNAEQELERTFVEIQKRQQAIGELDAQLATQATAQAEQEAAIAALQAEEIELNTKIEATQLLLDEERSTQNRINRKLDATRNEYKLTKSLVESLEGFPESIKYLSKSKEWPAAAPLLSDLIYCDPAYRVAIENYLDTYLNYYVVADKSAAITAIQLLRKAEKGKANFFLLNAFEPTSPTSEATLTDAVRALDIVQVDPQYLPLVSHLLADVWIITGSFDEWAPPPGIVGLAQSGAFVQRAHSISGGSVGTFEGSRIGRKKNLELLQKQINDLELEAQTHKQAIADLETQLKNWKQINLGTQIRNKQRQLDELLRETVSMRTRRENFATYLAEAEQIQTQKRNTITELNTKIDALRQGLSQKRTQADQLKSDISSKDESYRTIADALTRASDEHNNKRIQFVRQQNKINALQKEIAFRKKRLTELATRLDIDQRNLAQADTELDQITLQLQDLQQQLESGYAQRSDQKAYLNHAEEVFYQARQAITEVENQIRHLNRQGQVLQNGINALKDDFNALKLEWQRISERLDIEFGLNANALLNRQPTTDYPLDELQQRTERLKQRLLNYGEINAMAIEAYDEMKERFDFITLQKNDLLDAKQSLLDTIQEIETVAVTRFMEAFEEARENFKRVFRGLFLDNDDCDLILADPQDPLESRINIMAKPKGKRPQSINQLSGGEKTLTATALLFALYLLKPAPFCIFDEVDAPLDDANIGKFNRIIKDFSKDSQFIIVTHNKQTMAAVDIIYGVTNRDGISEVVPVDFRNLK